MQTTLIVIATLLISAVIFIPIGVFIRKKVAESKIQSAEKEAQRLMESVKVDAENLKKEELIKAKEEVLQIRNELDVEIKERRGDIQTQERRLIQKMVLMRWLKDKKVKTINQIEYGIMQMYCVLKY